MLKLYILISIALFGWLFSFKGTPAQVAPFAVVSAADYQAGAAPEMIVAGFTAAIGNVNAAAAALPLPTMLAGFSVQVRDSAGIQRGAGLFAVAPGQINFLIPLGTAEGTATISLMSGETQVAAGSLRITTIVPGLFTANASGRGAPAGSLLKIAADGSRTESYLVQLDSKNRSLAQPFDAGEAGSQFYLILFGTGLRNTRGMVSAGIGTTGGTTPVPVAYAGAQSEFAGLDQVNLGPLPGGLAGKLGEVELRVTVDGQVTNSVTIAPTGPLAGQWGVRANLPEANSEMSVAELDGKIYVIGGYPSSRVTVATVQVYDAASNTWSLAAPLPTPVNHSMPAVVNGKLYVIGGQSDAGSTNFVNTVYEYDPATNTWRTRAPLPIARGGGAAAVIDGKIYVAGGRPPRGADFAVFDPALNQWTTLPDLMTQRNHLAAVAVDGKVIVIGGRFEAGSTSPLTDALEIYDPKTNTWKEGARLPKPRGGLNAVEARGCVHVFGGEGNTSRPNGVFDDHDVYNPFTNTWTNLAPMPIAIHGVTGLSFLNGLIYLPGGGLSQGGSSGGTQHQVYRPLISCQ